MSRAFTKETDGQELDELPERVVSAHRNLVTARGLAQIESKLFEAPATFRELTHDELEALNKILLKLSPDAPA